MTKRHWKIILNVGLAGLLFEFVAFSDFDGALANDLHMLEAVGGSTATGSFPPPNIVFIFDTSGSMTNLICEDFDQCGDASATNSERSGPNSSTICYNTVYDGIVGIDKDQDGTADGYIPAFASDGYTPNRYGAYPIFDSRTTSDGDEYFLPGATYEGRDDWDPSDIRETGVGGTPLQQIEDGINRQCQRLPNCNQRSRCIFSLRTQGYFWESNCSPSGDPMNICGGGTGTGYKCDEDGACGAGECAAQSVDEDWCTCGPCDYDSDCTGTCTADPACAHLYCSEASCTIAADCAAVTAGQIGSCCSTDTDCSIGECDSETRTCSRCDDDADCTGKCVRRSANCTHAYCDDLFCEVVPPGNLGASCAADADCDGVLVCSSSACSTCIADSDCTGATNLCVSTGCSHSYCSETGTCAAGSGGAISATCSDGTGNDTQVYLGDWLNFYPPKYVGLIKAFTATVEDMGGDARIGISTFGHLSGGDINYRIDGDCTEALSSDCLDVTTSTVCFDPHAAALRNWLYTSLSFSGTTPLARALDNVGHYFSDSTTAAPENPICDYASITGLCADGNVDNFAILISDGFPYNDASGTGEVPWTHSQVGMSNGYYSADADWLDDVAHALSEIDHRSDLAGDQFVNTYTVSFGLLDPSDPTLCAGVMEEAAVAGGGQCFPADSADSLRQALTEVIVQIQKKIHGFAAPATSATRRTDSTSLSAALFRPSVNFPLWEGHVFGLQVCDETLGSCTCPVAGDDVCVVDSAGAEVAYDTEGYMTSAPFWDAQLCLSKDPGNPPPGGLGPDQAGLDTTACYLSPANRVIYTAVDTSGDGDLTIADTKIAFTTANVVAVPEFLTALDTASVVADAQEVVNFFRGYDTGDYDGDGNSTEPRNLKTMLDASSSPVDGWWVLGDIFHSIPNVVTRPDGRGLGSWATTASYKAFQTDNTARIKTMLVGANDGMLHAFHTGAWDAGNEVYDNGLGKELWAFVSPELLPELKSICDPTIPGGCGIGNHRYLVDGSVMVRDVWVGAHTDDKLDSANKTKWKTVAIYGHRRGGTTYVALDVTDITNPIFLWQFPQPGSAEEALVAQSWLDVFPAPASIGPLYVEDAANNRYDRWVALLSGGYDPIDDKGNALFIVDAYTGAKLWGVTKTSNGSDTDEMKYSFPATPVFYSRVGGSSPYIDGIVAADHGGQIWHVPVGTTPLDLTSPSLTPEIVFRSNATLINTDSNGGNNDGVIDPGEYQTRPFFFAPTLTRMQGKVRVIIGTGDRDHMVPQGTVPPTDGSYGTACAVDGDCAIDCHGGRCAECHNDTDCTGTCETTNCLYQFCSETGCAAPLDATGLDPDINDLICNEAGRIYSINLNPCPDGSGGFRPCVESDLQAITIDTVTPTNSVYSNAGDIGWYYVLDPGEKAATPYEILGGFGMYTTFYPTAGCNRGGDICSADSRGDARLYARHYVTGSALDWDDDGTLVAGEAVVDLGSGVPTAPAVSVAIDGGQATPTLMAGGSDTGLQARSAAGLIMQMAMEILRFPVSKKLHSVLHP